MGIRKDLIDMYDTYDSRRRVYQRDHGRCVICNAPAVDPHEIVSRSAFASTKEEMELCFSDKNRASVCRRCHNEYQGIPDRIAELLQIMASKYGYAYPEKIYQRYLGLGCIYECCNCMHLFNGGEQCPRCGSRDVIQEYLGGGFDLWLLEYLRLRQEDN
jgi:hypothetical protein